MERSGIGRIAGRRTSPGAAGPLRMLAVAGSRWPTSRLANHTSARPLFLGCQTHGPAAQRGGDGHCVTTIADRASSRGSPSLSASIRSRARRACLRICAPRAGRARRARPSQSPHGGARCCTRAARDRRLPGPCRSSRTGVPVADVQMHALVGAVVLRAAGPPALQVDAQRQPPRPRAGSIPAGRCCWQTAARCRCGSRREGRGARRAARNRA